MRVAFPAFGDTSWTGGLNYLRNLFSALAELPGKPVRPLMFLPGGAAAGRYASLLPYLAEPPVVMPGWVGGRVGRLVRTTLRGVDHATLAVFKAHRIDLVFYNDAWYGSRFPLPTLAWITDFQHCRMPELFTPFQRLRRSAKFSAYIRCADALMVSSEDARHDCERHFPASRGAVQVVRFAVQTPAAVTDVDCGAVLARYGLPERFVYFPGQLWEHKNHLLLLQAIRELAERGQPITVVATGSPMDTNHPGHPELVLRRARQWGLESSFRFLGLVPYADLLPLMRCCVAMINPSLFEGWSTTVEEAKSLGVPMVLSDLPVHREQAGGRARFFDARSSGALADALARAWTELPSGPRRQTELEAIERYRSDRSAFARRFAEVAALAVARGRERT